MVQTNKILTVSYGTFSCTLEGFDESFETMKAIAEYFRDLAADDRYFGAEPPTPDVEMLARIAEKEISRRVEARFENDGIVLRPSLAAATDADTAGDPEAQPETETKAEAVTPQPVETPEDVPSETPEAAQAETTEAEAQDAELEAASDALSEPVAEISDDTAKAEEADSMADAPAPADLSDAAPQEDATAEDHADTLTDAEAASDLDDMPADTAVVAQDTAPAAPMVQAEAPQVYAPGEDPAIKAASPSKVPESIAEKLARIRAVVSSAASAVTSHDSKPEAPQQPVEEAVVDAPVAETTAEDTSDITATEDRAEDATTEDTLVSNIMSTLSSGAADDTLTTAEPSDDEVAETAATEEALVDMGQDYTVQQVETPVMHDAAEAEGSIAATISEDDATDFADMHTAETGEDMAEVGATEDDTAEADAADAVYSDNFADMAGAADLEEATEAFDLTENMAITEEAEDSVASDQADAPETADLADAPEQDETPEALDLSDMVATDEQADAAEDTAQDGPIAPRRVAPRRAVRVVKVKRRSTQTDAPGAPLMADTGDSTLAPEDEADLMRELAELEADFTPAEQAPEATKEEAAPEAPLAEDTAQDISDVVDDTARTIRAMARRERRDSFAEDEGDVSRLLAETDEQLQEPEGRSRRNAIAHLRAAVAATRADRGGDAKPAGTRDRGEAYRDDLAQAVRPRRSTVETPQERPRIAPLKLVAEQRVDLPETEVTAPRAETAAQAVRPRRVSMPVERDEGPEAGGFATFAEEVGASRLPELLEAAAAYMSFVEGRDQFSRPQLMTKVRQIERGDSSREDRLRSFGQLLRDGKIEKVQGGRFTASDSIRFRPDDRAAG